MTFAETLRALRIESGLNLSQLAGRAGCDHSMLSRCESGERLPSRALCLALAKSMALDEVDRLRLLVAAGFMPDELIAPLNNRYLLAYLLYGVAANGVKS